MTTRVPQDPMIGELIGLARKAQVNRRQVLQGAGLGAMTLALAACGVGQGAGPQAAPDASDRDPSLTWANWPDYLDEDESGNHRSLERFLNETGITVRYKTTIKDNETYYATIKEQLRIGQYTGADTFCLTEWMVARLVRFGYLQELDPANIPNKKNLAPALANPDFDPGRMFSLPWQNGFTGLAWNVDEVPAGLVSVDDLWKPELKGKVSMLSEMRDTVGLIMLNHGVDISGSEWGTEQFLAALTVVEAQIGRGQALHITSGDDYLKDFKSGKVVAGFAYSNDITRLNDAAGREQWKFALPSAGGTLWGDSFVVPLGATHKANAEALMNFYYEPEVAATVAASVKAVSPVVGAKEVADYKFPEVAQNPLIFPNGETLSKASIFRSLSAADYQRFRGEFQQVM